MKPNIINDSGVEVSEDILNKWTKNIVQELTKKKIINEIQKKSELALVFLNENDAKKLNWNYRCKDYPTDILSFESDDPTTLGELVICPQVIMRNSKDNGVTFEEELGYAILHGILHVLGFDHEKDKTEEKVMMSLQDEVFEAIRYGDKKKKIKSDKKTDKKVEKKIEVKKAKSSSPETNVKKKSKKVEVVAKKNKKIK